jgi:voltage-gated potassium channel Kch
VLSIAATPLIMIWYQLLIVPKFMSQLTNRKFDEISEENSVIIAGFGRFGQVIGRFLSGHNITITVLEKQPEQIDMLRKFGFKGYFGDATRLDLLINAGAKKAKMLIIAVDNIDASLKIAKLAKKEFPNLTVYARSRNREHAYKLNKLGVHYFKRETFDSALNMAKDAMIFLGANELDVNFRAEKFKKHDEETLQESFKFFEDEKSLINFAKDRRKELEQILQSDVAL